MYEVVSIDEALMTRFIMLRNRETGTMDECFDDSLVVSDNNFWFMKEGGKYDCKIQLFGNVVPTMQEGAVLCKVIARDVMVGKRNRAKVLVGGDIYYLCQYEVNNLAEGDLFYYDASRKDLIQVDDVIHADLLREPK